GVHAAQVGDVDGVLGLGAQAGEGHALGIVGADLVAASGDLQVVGPDAGIDAHRAGDDVGVGGAAAVQARALDADLAPADGVTVQAPLVQDRCAGGQGRTVGVDEAAARTADTGRVGDDHLSAVAGHLDIAVQVTGGAGIRFVVDTWEV